MEDVVIVSAVRTPVGSFNGAFGAVPAHVLGQTAIGAAISRAGIEPGDVDEVILGQVLTAAQGQNPARQAARAAGGPARSPAVGITQVCGRGRRPVARAAPSSRPTARAAASKRRARRRRPASARTRSPRSRSRAARARPWSKTTSTSATTARWS